MQNVFSQSVTLDSTFGVGGKVVNPINLLSDMYMRVEEVENGKILVLGLKDFELTGNIYISRYNSDGSLDLTFGSNGITNTPLISETGSIYLMKLLSNGKILVTGSRSNNSTNLDLFDFATMRYNADGTLDTTFGNNGIVLTDLNGKGDIANGIDVQSDDKIIVAGYTYLNNNQDIVASLVRYLPDGSLDTSFGTNGRSIQPLLAPGSNDRVTSIKIANDDKIILGGYTSALAPFPGFYNCSVYKLNSNGNPDATFGSNGAVISDFSAFGEDIYFSITLMNNSILAMGYSAYNGISTMVIAKYLDTGAYDTTFGINGVVNINKNSSSTSDFLLHGMIINDNKILCSGYTLNENSNYDSLLILFNSDGTIDSNFNNDGYITTNFNNYTDFSYHSCIQSDGKVVSVGGATNSSNTDLDASIIRFDIDQLSENQIEKTSFSIYPNPFQNQINIKTNSVKDTEIELYDVFGRRLYAYSFQNQNDVVIPIDENLSKGNYIIKITSDSKTETHKLIKQ
jgi:uncharacterized delta-60 repeat protein